MALYCIQEIIHPTVTCDGCNQSPIQGIRRKCMTCPDYDNCETCFANHVHNHELQIVTHSGRQNRAFVPLKEIKSECNVNGSFYSLKLSQTFVNTSTDVVNTVYSFPSAGSIHHMEIKFGDKILTSALKEKAEAKAIYDESLAKGHGAVMATMSKETKDEISIHVGSILPQMTVVVDLFMAGELKWMRTDKDQEVYQLVLPTNLGPRYSPKDQVSNEPSPIFMDTEDPSAYLMGSTISFTNPKYRFTKVQSSTVPFNPKFTNDGDLASISLPPFVPDKDIVVELLAKRPEFDLDKISISFETSAIPPGNPTVSLELQRYAVKVNCWVDDSSLPQLNPSQTQRDFVFIVDCSGSMSDRVGGKTRIQCAKEALGILLRALSPLDTFNIIFFADDFKSMSNFPLASKEHFEKAEKFIEENCEANGGTDIDPVIQFLNNYCEKNPCSRREVLLITDGEISNASQVIETACKSKNRWFTIGIGESCGRDFIDSIALRNEGRSEYVVSDQDSLIAISNKQMKRALQPRVSLHFEWSGKLDLTSVRLSPIYQQFQDTSILPKEPCSFYSLLDIPTSQFGNPFLKTSLRFENQEIWTKTYEVPLGSTQRAELNAIAARQFLRNYEDDLYSNKVDESLRKKIVQISQDTGVLCSETAFIAVDQRNNPLVGVTLVNHPTPSIAKSFGLSMQFDACEVLQDKSSPTMQNYFQPPKTSVLSKAAKAFGNWSYKCLATPVPMARNTPVEQSPTVESLLLQSDQSGLWTWSPVLEKHFENLFGLPEAQVSKSLALVSGLDSISVTNKFWLTFFILDLLTKKFASDKDLWELLWERSFQSLKAFTQIPKKDLDAIRKQFDKL